MRRDLFTLPPGIYLDGNSLGLMPYAAREGVLQRLLEWETQAVSGWDDWFGLSEKLAPQVARLVGANPLEVAVTGSITTNLHALLATFYRPTGIRRNLLATALDFPTDLYALESWTAMQGADLVLIPSRDFETLHPDDLLESLTEDIAVVLLPTVLYRSGQRLDVQRFTRAAHQRGILVGWDAAHSIGAMPHYFHDHGADFAVWCHYKYVNGGPGAPGGLFVHGRHLERTPALRGWWGHEKSTQFEMRGDFRRSSGANAFQQGTPSILALAALEGALTVFENLDLLEVRRVSLELTDHLMALCDEFLPEMRVVTPRAHQERGGHVALAHPAARTLSLALRSRGVVADFRAPEVLRLAPVALYNTQSELEQTVQLLRGLLDEWNAGTLEPGTNPIVT